MTFEVTEIWRYPVKSMAGERVDAASISPAGIDGDRRWGLRSAATGMIVSAKRPNRYGKLLDWEAVAGAEGVPVVTSPDGDTYEAGNAELDAALSESLGESVSMVRVTSGAEETYDSEWPELPGTAFSDTTMVFPVAMMTEKESFVDLAALHLILQGSLDLLGEMVESEVVAQRFRPSIVVRRIEGAATPTEVSPFEEVSWSETAAQLGEVDIWIADAAPRCVMTTVPQRGLGPARDVLQTLAARSRKEMEGFGAFACFGSYAEVKSAGRVAVGDHMTLA